MSSPSAERYDRWKAPAEDGKNLIWPAPGELLHQTLQNHRQLAADSAHLQNVPLAEARRRLRKWIGHEDDRVLVATGHQTELCHPGVWAKNALIDSVAARLDGRAFHFAVDTDGPKHLQVRWPGGSVALSDDPALGRAEWSGLVAAPTPGHLGEIEAALTAAASHWDFRPVVPRFLQALRRTSSQSGDLPSVLTDSLHQLDWDLGLRYDAMLVAPICWSEPYLLFVHHVLSRAGEFAGDYNASLDEFRRRNRIRTPGRPMPNLKCSAESCEVPFWLDSLEDGTRQRAAVSHVYGQWILRHHNDEFQFDPKIEGWIGADALLRWLRERGLRLAPRALTLTAVLRLLVADQFVHGIGGGQYDQVLDALIARHFHIEPPAFSVTTATLLFPQAVRRERVCLPCLVQQGHRMKHRVLGQEKMQLVRQIASLPRRSATRSALFSEMHSKLSAAWSEPPIRQWEQDFRDAEERAQQEQALFDRELFYAIQPRERLTALIDQYRQAQAET